MADRAIDAGEWDVVDDAVDGFCDNSRKADDSEDTKLLESLWERDGIGDDDGIKWVLFFEKAIAWIAKDGVDGHHANAIGAIGLKGFCTGNRASAGIDHIVDHDAVSAFDITDDVHDFWFEFVVSSLIDDGDWSIKHLSKVTGTVNTAVVWRDNSDVLAVFAALNDIISKKRNGSEVID